MKKLDSKKAVKLGWRGLGQIGGKFYARDPEGEVWAECSRRWASREIKPKGLTPLYFRKAREDELLRVSVLGREGGEKKRGRGLRRRPRRPLKRPEGVEEQGGELGRGLGARVSARGGEAAPDDDPTGGGGHKPHLGEQGVTTRSRKRKLKVAIEALESED